MTIISATEDADTTWFDLDLYKEFEKMPPVDWIWQLEVRAYYRGLLQVKLAKKPRKPKASPKKPKPRIRLTDIDPLFS